VGQNLSGEADASDGWMVKAELNYEQWRDALRPDWGLYTPDNPKSFVGRVRSRSIFGFKASDISNNSRRCERTMRDVRFDSVDHWYALFQLVGRSKILQNDRAVALAAGDVVLIDSARPLIFENGAHQQWLSVQLVRRPLVSHLGFEPDSGTLGDTRAGRLLRQLVQDAVEDEASASAPVDSYTSYMQLAFYDLLGALSGKPDAFAATPGTDKLFKRVCNIIKDGFADPGLSPSRVADEAGISLRYLQKLFTARNVTCSQVIQSVRLDHAGRLLRRRGVLNQVQPISEIAFASGFGDYTNFARKFRRRFGHAPGVHAKVHD
jgi:AraC family transcriptional regulator, positive regulator of tynA and feaB